MTLNTRSRTTSILLFLVAISAVVLTGHLPVAQSAEPAQKVEPAVITNPTTVFYQGYVKISETAYNGTGYFKFAVVNASANTTYWSNDGTSSGGSEPTASVSLNVQEGYFGVLLGDTLLGGMTQTLGQSAFSGPSRYLRVWFATSASGPFTALTPIVLAAVPYALNAETLDGEDSSFYRSASSLNWGTLSDSVFSAYSDLGAEGYLGNATGDLARNNGTLQSTLNADLLDGYQASQLATKAAFSGGDQTLELTVTPTVVRSVTLTVPTSGTIIVNASGWADFNGTGVDVVRCSITTGTQIDPAAAMLSSDFGATELEGNFSPIALTRGYSVSAGTYTYKLVCDSGAETSSVELEDSQMTALFIP